MSAAASASATLEPTEITVARGDGIGPEIMDATLRILEASKAQLVTHEIEIGEKVYKAGYTSGIKPEAWDLLRSTKVFLKAPITTPTGGGYKSLNVSVRKTLGLFANVRPVQSMHPFVQCDRHPIDMGESDAAISRESALGAKYISTIAVLVVFLALLRVLPRSHICSYTVARLLVPRCTTRIRFILCTYPRSDHVRNMQ